VLKEANGNQSKASQLLGIDRKTLYLKLKKYGISQ
jgi:DNA-binding protein Fis